jgi:hypothetical protein
MTRLLIKRCLNSLEMALNQFLGLMTSTFQLEFFQLKFEEPWVGSFSFHRATGKFKGCSFLTFYTDEATAAALELDGKDLFGKSLRVEYSQERTFSTAGSHGPVGRFPF